MAGRKAHKTPHEPITTFGKYLEKHCPGITEAQANGYAERGKALLDGFNNKNPPPADNITKSDNMACIHWFLIKDSFKQGKPFSKGMFNLELSTPEQTKKLFTYLKGDSSNEFKPGGLSTGMNFLKSLFKSADLNEGNSYSRDSTHYRKHLHRESGGHFGIDKHGEVPLAWKFTTHAFGLTENKDKTVSIYIKPETFSADLNKTWESVKHGLQLFKTIIGKKDKLHGLSESYRENQLPTAIKDFAKERLGLDQENPEHKQLMKAIDKCKSRQALEILIAKHDRFAARDIIMEIDQAMDKEYSRNQVGSEIRVLYVSDAVIKPEVAFKDSMRSVRETYSEEMSSAVEKPEPEPVAIEEEHHGDEPRMGR